MIHMLSSPCETAGEQADASDSDPGFGAGDGGLEVLGEAAVASEPCEGAFDPPASGFGLEGSDALRPGDDLDRPLAEVGDRVEQFVAAIDAVGAAGAPPGGRGADGCEAGDPA